MWLDTCGLNSNSSKYNTIHKQPEYRKIVYIVLYNGNMHMYIA